MAIEGSDCITGKHQYATRQVANEVAKSARSRGWPCRSYRCPWCGCYHIGNPRRENSKSRHR